jgi:pilus assembly protein CpaB
LYKRLVLVFLFAVIIAGGASYLVYRMIVGGAQGTARSGALRAVIANRNLQVGELIRDGDVSEVSWSDTLPDAALKSANEAVGRGAITPIFKNEPVVDGRLAARGAGAGLAATIPMGKRAVAIRVDEVIGLAGFVQPGMRVDVLVAGNAPDTRMVRYGTLSRTVLQDIEVLSAGQRIDRNADGKPESAQVVNLLVTPDQAEVLSLAGSETKVQLALRNPLDTEELVTTGSSLSSLFGALPGPPEPQSELVRRPQRQPVVAREIPPAKPHVIEIFSGVKRVEQPMESDADNK